MWVYVCLFSIAWRSELGWKCGGSIARVTDELRVPDRVAIAPHAVLSAFVMIRDI